jgi:hypothetical protein
VNNSALGTLLGLAACGGVFVLFVGIFVGLAFLLKRTSKALAITPHSKELRALVEDWADEEGYEVLEVGTTVTGQHPWADRFGFGFGKKPAIVRDVEMKDRKGRVRQGWVYVRIRMFGRAFAGYVADSLEVAWDD